MSWDKKFFIADEEAILSGQVSDVYFERGKSILEKRGINPFVYGEVTTSGFPEDWKWGILSGVAEVLKLFEGKLVTVRTLLEGSLFYEGEPVMSIEGKYNDFGIFETALLGFLCQSTGITTKSGRFKLAAKGKPVYSFGARRMHPAIAPAIERSAFIGGCDGVSAIESARAIGEKPVGTMPHAYIICFGDEIAAYKAFDEEMPEDIKRIALIDTYQDEKFGALKAVEALGKKLFAVRLDTPSSRRGNFRKIIEEVRWELNIRGFSDVKIFLSGGLNERMIEELSDIADAFGVGTEISNPQVVDFAFDIVEKEGKPVAKRGKKSGKKQVFECEACLQHLVLPISNTTAQCTCGKVMKPLLIEVISNGKLLMNIENSCDSRLRALKYLKKLENRKLASEGDNK